MQKLITTLHSYLQYPEVVKLLNCRHGEDGVNPDRHSKHVYDGYSIIFNYKYGQDKELLYKAVQYLDRVVSTDMKYLQALALYGKVIAYGMAGEFKKASNSAISLTNFTTYGGLTDYWQEIDDIRHYAGNEILPEIKKAFSRLYPNKKWNGEEGCLSIIIFFIVLSASCCFI